MPRHAFTKAERDRQVEEACARAVTPDRNLVTRQIDMMSRMASANSGRCGVKPLHDDPEYQRAAMDAAAWDYSFHGSGVPRAGEAPTDPSPSEVGASFPSKRKAA